MQPLYIRQFWLRNTGSTYGLQQHLHVSFFRVLPLVVRPAAAVSNAAARAALLWAHDKNIPKNIPGTRYPGIRRLTLWGG